MSIFQTASPFPLGIANKADSFEKLQLMASIDPTLKFTAEEFNKILAALAYLYNSGTGNGGINFLGTYDTYALLVAAHPAAAENNFAFTYEDEEEVTGTFIYIWNTTSASWVKETNTDPGGAVQMLIQGDPFIGFATLFMRFDFSQFEVVQIQGGGVYIKLKDAYTPQQLPVQTLIPGNTEMDLSNFEGILEHQETPDTTSASFTPVGEVLNGKWRRVVDTTGEADFPPVNSIWKFTVSGTSGTATLSIGINDYTLTFNTNATTTLSDFITAEQANILADTGLNATAVGAVLSLIGVTADAVSMANATGDLAGVKDEVLCRQLAGSDFEEGEFDLFAECVKIDSASPKTNLVNYFWIKR